MAHFGASNPGQVPIIPPPRWDHLTVPLSDPQFIDTIESWLAGLKPGPGHITGAILNNQFFVWAARDEALFDWALVGLPFRENEPESVVVDYLRGNEFASLLGCDPATSTAYCINLRHLAKRATSA